MNREPEDSPVSWPHVENCETCGAPAGWEEGWEEGPIILCSGCGRFLTVRYFESPEETAAEWNEQPRVRALEARIAELEARA